MTFNLLMGDSRAVSETLGYIIIFGIVFTCIGILVVSGNQIISNTEDRTMFQGIEQSFNVLSSDLRKTAFDATPMRTLQIRFDGSMSFSPDDVEIKVLSFDESHTVYAGNIGSIKFVSATTPQSISLENNAVIRNYADYSGGDVSIMSYQPRMYVSDATKTLMISAMNLEGTNEAMGGKGVADIQLKYGGISTYSYTPADHKAKIKIKTVNTIAWTNYLKEQFKSYNPVVTSAGGWVEVTLANVDEIKVIEYKINVDMS